MSKIVFDQETRNFSVVEDQREFTYEKNGKIYRNDGTLVGAKDNFDNVGKNWKTTGSGTNVKELNKINRVGKAATPAQVKANKAAYNAFKPKQTAARKAYIKGLDAAKKEAAGNVAHNKERLQALANARKLAGQNKNLKIGAGIAAGTALGAGAYAAYKARQAKKRRQAEQ